MKRFFLLTLFSTLIIATVSIQSSAQCSLCKSSAESSLKEGNTQAQGLNMGIMYLLAMPYILVGGLGYYWYANQKKLRKESGEEA